MNCDLLVCSIECESCTEISENLKPVIPVKQYQSHKPCLDSNQEIKIDFTGPINNNREQKTYFLTFFDRFPKYTPIKLFENKKTSNLKKILDNYIQFHAVPCSLTIDQVHCLIGNQVKKFCIKININLIFAPANDRRAISLIEVFISTTKQRPACLKKQTRSPLRQHLKQYYTSFAFVNTKLMGFRPSNLTFVVVLTHRLAKLIQHLSFLI